MAKKKGFNDYEVIGDTAYIYLTNKKQNEAVTKIDADDLLKIKNLGLHWGYSWYKCPQTFYVTATEYSQAGERNKRYRTHMLHRIIMDTDNSLISVDHIDHDGFNNKKENLRLSTIAQNTKNREKNNSNNVSGYRNVCWMSKKKKWRVQIQIDGKCTKIKDFPEDQLESAGKLAEDMRKKYYKEFSGNN